MMAFLNELIRSMVEKAPVRRALKLCLEAVIIVPFNEAGASLTEAHASIRAPQDE